MTNADGRGDRVLAVASRQPGAPNGCAQIVTPAWSPDGHWIAFGRLMNSPPTGIDLYLISPSGKHLHRLTHQPNMFNVAPTWSADGKRIAFEFGRRNGAGEPVLNTLAVIDRDGSHRHTILRIHGNMYGSSPHWQPR